MEPKFLLDDDQFAQVLGMKVDTLRALAAAMGIDVTGDPKPAMISVTNVTMDGSTAIDCPQTVV